MHGLTVPLGWTGRTRRYCLSHIPHAHTICGHALGPRGETETRRLKNELCNEKHMQKNV